MGEDRALSFGALYHPWLHHRRQEAQSGTAVILAPPDGVVCGMIAARALNRGAWIAPANEPLRSVVALKPTFNRGEWANLFATQINLVRQDPRGFMLLSADTLSSSDLLRPINVRRLLILLRRLALREGNAYVFQGASHDELIKALDPEWPGPIPHTILVAPGGEVVYRHNGEINGEELRAKVLELMGRFYVPEK